jgi:hypothetical protein
VWDADDDHGQSAFPYDVKDVVVADADAPGVL